MAATIASNSSHSKLDEKHELENTRSGLEEYEREDTGRPPFILTLVEAKLLGIAGVGFFLDGACIVPCSVDCS